MVYAVLLKTDLISEEIYNEHLDNLFMKKPDDRLLLDLETCFGNTDKAIQIIFDNIHEEQSFDYNCFRKILFEKLETIYNEECTDNIENTKKFFEKTYRIWLWLPLKIKYEQPFFTLCYADDIVKLPAEGDTSEIEITCRKMFDFYK